MSAFLNEPHEDNILEMAEWMKGMKNRTIFLSGFVVVFCAMGMFCAMGFGQTERPAGAEDVSSRVETVGNPGRNMYLAKSMVYARNIWDMQVFDGRIYFGMGNSNNRGPAPNAKGGQIWSYDPKGNRFKVEWEADEEQVDRFRILNGKLVVPGHDPTDSWQYGNWYRLEPNGWKKHRNIPGGIHCYDMACFNGKMFAALGTKPHSEFVVMSENDGKTWTGCGILGMRAYTLFTVADNLYVSLYRGVAAYDGKRFQENIDYEWFPGYSGKKRIRLIVRPVHFKGATVYIGANLATDHQWTPFGLYAAENPYDVKKIDLPGNHWDLLVKDGVLYVLSDVKSDTNKDMWLIRVTATRDLTAWQPLLQFESPAFARSFEYLDGAFYFGLGCEAHDLRPETGRILRVPWVPQAFLLENMPSPGYKSKRFPLVGRCYGFDYLDVTQCSLFDPRTGSVFVFHAIASCIMFFHDI